MSAQQLPPDYEDLEFRVTEENWNDYELQGGYTLKARSVLLKVMRVRGPQPGQDQIGTAGQDIFIVTSAPRRGPPSPLTPQEVSGLIDVTRRVLRIERSNELWNVYEVPRTGNVIRTRLMITDISVVENRFDNFGYPAMIIRSGVITNVEGRNADRQQA
jgi:hypothetical protein